MFDYKKRIFSPLERKHLSLLKDWRNKQMDVLRQTKPLTDFDQEKWWLRLKKDKSQSLFAIGINSEEGIEFVGYCGLTNIDYSNKRAEISFLVSPERADSKKIYREDFLSALSWLCRHGFKELKLNKIFAETFDFRKDHIKIVEEFGFKKKATFRKQYFKKGKFYDSIVHFIFAKGNKKY